MAEMQSSRNVNAREALECIRGQMSNSEIMEKFKITPQGYADLLRQLFMRKLITEEDMLRRGIRFKIIKNGKQPAASEPDAAAVDSAPEPEVACVPTPLVAPAASAEDDEFLDTVMLTELLTFKPPPPPQQIKRPAQDAPKLEDIKEENGSTEKKGRFSISDFFKKAR